MVLFFAKVRKESAICKHSEENIVLLQKRLLRDMNQPLDKNRIEYIDLAKGFCILLVVFHHVACYYQYNYSLWVPFQSFRMPLYFILSGIFFKKYDGFISFLKRKTNKLAIPFLFFYICTSIPLTVLLMKKTFVEALGSIIKDFYFENGGIWFLLSLFEVNLIFYLLQMIAEKSCYKKAALGVLSLICGFVGLMLSFYDINCVLFLGCSLTVIPFFYFGSLLGSKDRLALHYNLAWWQEIIIIAVSVTAVLLFSHEQEFGINVFSNYYSIYPCGILGTSLVLLVSKRIRKLPFISYLGKYSIIVLCTHPLIMKPCRHLLNLFSISNTVSLWITFFLIIVSMLLVIPVCRRYIPYFTAQKDLIRV